MYRPKSHSYRCAYKLHTVPCTGLRVTATGVLINYIPYRTGLRVTATDVLINYIPYRHSYRCAYKLHTVPCTGLRVTATGVLINYIPYRVQAYEVMIESVYIRHWTHWTFVVCVAGSTC